MRIALFTALAAAALLTTGCASSPPPAVASATLEPTPPVVSSDPRVKYKDGERYLGDLSDALGMDRATICRELGRYDCFTDAFRIVLGGAEGPNLLVNEPLEVEALTAPIAYDRVALHVCTSRVEQDIASPVSAVLFRPQDRSGRKASQAWLTETADTLYGTLLRRDATASERTQLVEFYNDVSRSKSTQDATRDWTVLSCFMVATSLEAIFY